MKRLALLVALLTSVQTFAAPPAGSPLIRFAHPAYDYGRIASDGGIRIHSFIFRNEGAAPLVILKTYTSCECSEVSYPPRPVMPGDSAAIRVRYDPSKQKGKGTFFKTIQVYSNDPGKRSVLTIKGEIY